MTRSIHDDGTYKIRANSIHLIRSIRRDYGMGLKEAKDAVDEFLAKCEEASRDETPDFMKLRNQLIINTLGMGHGSTEDRALRANEIARCVNRHQLRELGIVNP